MFRAVSKITEKIKGSGRSSLVQLGALLTLEPEPYYAEMKELARQVRKYYKLVSSRVGPYELRRIYKAQGIRLTLWPGKVGELRGAYFNDELGVNVMVMKELPEDTLAFTMAHELKHHLVDSDLKSHSEWIYDPRNPIEVGAEAFAAELIYPEQTFRFDLQRMRVRPGECPLNVLLRLKRKTQTTLPYRIFRERAVSIGFAAARVFRASSWKKMEKEKW
jgi:Zn-dependent peptidase ImmA (M78 family)